MISPDALNIVIPMAGRGSRFAEAGFLDPKPLIRFGGKPMVQWVVENITPLRPHRFIFICLEDHLKEHPGLASTLRAICSGCEIVGLPGVTEGAAATVLAARHLIDNKQPLMIANSDQYVETAIDGYLDILDKEHADGLIMTFHSDDPKWSYARTRDDGTIREVVEKKVVSNMATVGIYNFRQGSDFVSAAEAMIARDLRVNGEFYVAPAYNLLIERGHKIVPGRLTSGSRVMWGLGTPSDLAEFLHHRGLSLH